MDSKMRCFLRDTSVLGVASLLVRFVSIAASRYLSKSIGDAGMGLCALVGSVGGFAATLATAGVGFAITRLYPAEIASGRRTGAKEIVGAAFLLSLAFGLIAALPLLLLSGVIGRFLLGNVETVPALIALALSLPFTAVSSALGGYFIAIRRSRVGAVVRVGEQLLRFSLLPLLLSMLADRGLRFACLAVVLASGIAEGVSCLFLALCFLREKKAAKAPGKAAIVSVFTVAFPILLSSLFRSSLTTLEHLLIPRTLAVSGRDRESALASYGVLMSVALPLSLLPMAFLSAAASLLVVECAERSAAAGRKAVAALAGRALSATLVIGIGCSTLLLLLATRLGNYFGSGAELTDYLYLLAPVLPLMLVDHVTDAILRGIGEQVYSMWVNIADSLLSILLVLMLLPPLGARGYTVVILLAEIFNLSLSLGRLARVTGLCLDLRRSLVFPLLGSTFILGVGLFWKTSFVLPLLIGVVLLACMFYAFHQTRPSRKDWYAS